MDESQKYSAKWNKLDILHLIYCVILLIWNSRRKNIVKTVAPRGGEGEKRIYYKGVWWFFFSDGIILYYDCSGT